MPLRKAEDIEFASLRSFLRQIGHRANESKRRGAVARVEVARNDGAGPAAYARENCDILMAIRPAVADWLADDP
jgi:hypothetical protein